MAPNTHSRAPATAPLSSPPAHSSPLRQEHTQDLLSKQRRKPTKTTAATIRPMIQPIPNVSSTVTPSSNEVSSHPATSPLTILSPYTDDSTPTATGRHQELSDTPTPTATNKHNPASRPVTCPIMLKNMPSTTHPKVHAM